MAIKRVECVWGGGVIGRKSWKASVEEQEGNVDVLLPRALYL